MAALALVALVGCGNVIVDGDTGSGASGSGASGTGASGTGASGTGGAGGNTSSSSTSIVTTTETTTSGSTSGSTSGGCGSGCDEAITLGARPCDGPGFAFYGALLGASCGSMSMCGFPCNGNLCNFEIPTASCLSCVEANYPAYLQQCTSN